MAKSDEFAQSIIDMYAKLQQNIFAVLINALQHSSGDVDKDNVLQWQVEQLAKAGMLTKEVAKLVARVNDVSESKVTSMIHAAGQESVQSTTQDIVANLGNTHPVSPDVAAFTDSYLHQTMLDLSNNINESLITRNISDNAALRVYRSIVTQTTMEVSTGLKTHEQATRDNIYRWVRNGIPTKLTDSAGKGWSLEGYSRMVINTTQHRVINDMRMKTMGDNDVKQAKMSWHSAARPACAPIQGHIVNLVPSGSDGFDGRYDSIYNHEYGKASGTQGINCRHTLTPWDPDVNIDTGLDKRMPSAKEAQANSLVQQRQRSMERAIRQSKKCLAAAEQLGDEPGIAHFKSQISNQQANLRELIKSHDFLNRDYAREQIQTGMNVNSYRLPGASDAIIPEAKLTKYALDPTNTHGGADKARVFKSALGYTQDNYQDLIDQIHAGQTKYHAVSKGDAGYGMQYQVDMPITGPNGAIKNVRTAWIKDKQSGQTRLVSLYVKELKDE
ncbi:minor capsid protein [Furfurilactobacillus rossiae]|uniref:phage minor capsid protein n=1 Tax=Furfurilactobacillus rossiae TaxID=231049 RepID=UPI0015BCAAC3|nr:phage minor capsid protein [Furfurilactobacillus rossiae]QLE64003.1 minor capsid protein [Furfurilactobacillus rossiae]